MNVEELIEQEVAEVHAIAEKESQECKEMFIELQSKSKALHQAITEYMALGEKFRIKFPYIMKYIDQKVKARSAK
jgi:hypothetical protein